ncbi:MAG TPA: tail fiber protein [Myxococcota bacterium]|jgi:microcystin-dependent protein|nr:tail fiber protein [Myxococcota bacterium]
MAEPFVGDIRMFGGNFPPQGYARCDGQLVAIAQNDTLFNLIGTTYGGDGQQTFALPDLRGRVPVHQGAGPGLSPRVLGEQGGSESVTLTTNDLAPHAHVLAASVAPAQATAEPLGGVPAAASVPIYHAPNTLVDLSPAMVGSTGGTQPHENVAPSVAVTFIIALYGIYPSRN